MIGRTTSPLPRRALIVDDELGRATTAGGRAVSALAEELRARGIEVVEALSIEDGLAIVVSDSAIHCVFVNWTLGRQRKALPHTGHRTAPGGARPQRQGCRSF